MEYLHKSWRYSKKDLLTQTVGIVVIYRVTRSFKVCLTIGKTGRRAEKVQPQARHEDQKNLRGRPVGHHQPRGHQGLL